MTNNEVGDKEFRETRREVWCACDAEGRILGMTEADKGKLTPEAVLRDFADRDEEVFAYKLSCEEQDEHIKEIKKNPEALRVDQKAREGKRYVWGKVEAGEVYRSEVVTTELEILKPKIVFKKVDTRGS